MIQSENPQIKKNGKRQMMENDDDIKEINLKNTKEKISQKNITNKSEDNNESSTNNIYKDKIFVYTDVNKKKIYIYFIGNQEIKNIMNLDVKIEISLGALNII